MIDDDFVILAVHNDPSINNVLSFYVNDSEQEITFEDIDLTDPNEFHLLQVTSDGDSITHLESLGDKLIQFKKHTSYLIKVEIIL